MTSERVFMLWPTELKQRVREIVGARGMTDFVIAAVEDKLQHRTGDLVVESVEAVPDSPELPADDPEPIAPAVPARFDAATRDARTVHVEQTFGLRRASELDPPDQAAPTAASDAPTHEEVTTSFCQACHAPLIDGECWSCSI